MTKFIAGIFATILAALGVAAYFLFRNKEAKQKDLYTLRSWKTTISEKLRQLGGYLKTLFASKSDEQKQAAA
jgi:hypothetical protein